MQRIKSIMNSCFKLLSVGQGVDGQKGEKGECRIDDNLVSGFHSNLLSNVDVLKEGTDETPSTFCLTVILLLLRFR